MPKVTISVGERVIGKVNIEEVEVFRVAADALKDEADRIHEVGEILGCLEDSPIEVKRMVEFSALSKAFSKASKAAKGRAKT